jgi:hypothetical protein
MRLERVTARSGASRAMILHRCIHRREQTTDSNGLEAFRLHVARGRCDRGFVKFRIGAAIELVAAADAVHMPADGIQKVRRPVALGWHSPGCRQRDPQHPNFQELPALYEGIGEMGRADHDGRYRLGPGPVLTVQDCTNGANDAVAHIRGRGAFVKRNELAPVH